MKIAILISGYSRTLPENIKSINENIIQNHECDIYLHITDDEYNDKYLNQQIDLNKILEILKPKVTLRFSNLNFNSNKKINNLINQYYKYYKLNCIKNEIMEIENIKYDVVIKCRPDIFLHDLINYNNLNNDIIYIPNDSKIDTNKLNDINDPNLCDAFAYGTNSEMNKYFNLFSYSNVLLKKYGFVPETILYYYLTNYKINFCKINISYMFLLSKCNIIAVCGDSASGKTTISNYLKKLFNNSFSLECDRYHKWERDDKQWNQYTHLNPKANYIGKMNKDVFDLKYGKNIYQVNYDHTNGKFTDKVLIESKPNVIVCGLHSLYNKLNIINLKIFMDTDIALRTKWKIERDTKFRKYTKEEVLNKIKIREKDYKLYIEPQKYKSDIIINFSKSNKNNIILKLGIHKKFNLDKILDKFNKFNINYLLDNSNVLEFNYLSFFKDTFNSELFHHFKYFKNIEMKPYYNIILYIIINFNII